MTDLPVTVYTPESPLRRIRQLLREMFRDLVASRELAWRLFLRDTAAQYRQTLFGYAWVFIPPLIASLPFIFLNSEGVVAIQSTNIPYPAYAMIGTIIWQVFMDALNSPLKTISAAKSMLIRINFPREAILLSGLMQVLFSCAIRLILLAAIFAYFRIIPPWSALLFPIAVFALMTLGFMLGIALAPIGLLYSDVQQTIPIAGIFLMFLTPVLYPTPTTGFAATAVKWNPLTSLVTTARDWLTIGAASNLPGFVAVSAVVVLLLFAGWLFCRIALPHVIARIGN